jgi:hypothetical protein
MWNIGGGHYIMLGVVRESFYEEVIFEIKPEDEKELAM